MALFRSGLPGGAPRPSFNTPLSNFWLYDPFTPAFRSFVETHDFTTNPALARETQNFINSLSGIPPGDPPFASDPSRAPLTSAAVSGSGARLEFAANFEKLFGRAPPNPGRSDPFFGSPFRGDPTQFDVSEDIFFPQHLLMQGISPGALAGTDIRRAPTGADVNRPGGVSFEAGGGETTGVFNPAERTGVVSLEEIAALPLAQQQTGSFLIRGGHVSRGRRAGLIPV